MATNFRGAPSRPAPGRMWLQTKSYIGENEEEIIDSHAETIIPTIQPLMKLKFERANGEEEK